MEGRTVRNVLTVLLIASAAPAHATDLDKLLTSLYGGDGITLASNPVFDHSAHFRGDSIAELESLSLRALDLAIPLPSGDGGSSFVYDPIVDDFVETRGGLGTIFAERAGTLGKGRVSFGFNYQDISYSTFEGTGLNDLAVDLNHREIGGPGPDICVGGAPPNCHIIELDVVHVDLNMDLDVKLLTLFANYGMTDRWDVGIIAPIMDTRMSVKARATVQRHASAVFAPRTIHGFDPNGLDGDVPTDRVSGSHTGVGDIHLRSKYALMQDEHRTLSLSTHVRFSNGDESNLQGLDSTGGQLGLLYTHNFELTNGRFSPHVNLMYEVNAGTSGQEEIDLITGFEYSTLWRSQEFGGSLDLIFSEEVNNKDGIGDSVLDAAVSLRWEPNSQSAIYFGVQVPINRSSGLRADVITHVGYFVTL